MKRFVIDTQLFCLFIGTVSFERAIFLETLEVHIIQVVKEDVIVVNVEFISNEIMNTSCSQIFLNHCMDI